MISSLFAGTDSQASTDPDTPFDADADADADAVETTGDEAESSDAPETGGLPLDVTFEILKNRRRRLVLEYLRDATDTVRIGELAEHIAAIENDTDVQQLNSQQRKRVYIGLYQCHLPKMDDAGVIDFEQDRGLIDLQRDATPLFEYLDIDESSSPETPFRSYAALTLLGGATFAAATLANAQLVATVTVFCFLLAVLVLSYHTHTRTD